MPGQRFSRISLSSLERKSGSQLHPAPVFGPAHLLQIFACPKKTRARSSAEVQLPKLQKQLPIVLTRQQMEELLSAPLRVKKQSAAPAWMPLRDAAVLELFYSSGLRLSELAALDVADADLYTESVRVFGKGRKERVCPVG